MRSGILRSLKETLHEHRLCLIGIFKQSTHPHEWDSNHFLKDNTLYEETCLVIALLHQSYFASTACY